MSKEHLTPAEIQAKLEYYCAYQDRCHQEVEHKIWSFKLSDSEKDQLIVYLINNDFLNEERFARSFARGKHRIKHWGHTRIINELKMRHIGQRNITTALKEITPEEYEATFMALAERIWESIRDNNITKKRKKFCDYLLRKGWESNLVYEKMKEFNSSTGSD